MKSAMFDHLFQKWLPLHNHDRELSETESKLWEWLQNLSVEDKDRWQELEERNIEKRTGINYNDAEVELRDEIDNTFYKWWNLTEAGQRKLQIVASARANTPALKALDRQQAEFLSERQLAERIGISITTIRRWRWEGRELPKAVGIGRLIRYQKADVEEWIQRVINGTIHAGRKRS
jgi:predicted DNA-binding transcriptional regulator AlpA